MKKISNNDGEKNTEMNRFKDPPAHEIITGLWLGDCQAALDNNFIENKKIDVVVNCTVEFKFINLNIIKHRIPVHDNLKNSQLILMYKHLDKYAKIINNELCKGKRILVHCHAGRQRSLAIIIGYLMKYSGITYDIALTLIKTRRIVAGYPSLNFESSLKNYQRYLTENNL